MTIVLQRITFSFFLCIACLSAFADLAVNLLNFEPVEVALKNKTLNIHCSHVPKKIKHGLKIRLSEPNVAMFLNLPFVDHTIFQLSKQGQTYLIWFTSNQTEIDFMLQFDNLVPGSSLRIEAVPLFSFIKTIKAPVDNLEMSILKYCGYPIEQLIEAGLLKLQQKATMASSSSGQKN